MHLMLLLASYTDNPTLNFCYVFLKEYEVPCFLLDNFGPGDGIFCGAAGKTYRAFRYVSVGSCFVYVLQGICFNS